MIAIKWQMNWISTNQQTHSLKMFNSFIGEWPTHEKFILTSCDDLYFEKYFPRFYKTYKENWKLPIHIHIIDPSDASIQRLNKFDITYTHCTTDKSVLKWPYSYVTYCQAQRFILLGNNLSNKQSVIVADVDSYALKEPDQSQVEILSTDMAFTKFNNRLMATFCNFHYNRRTEAKQAADDMEHLIRNTDTIGVDQLVLKDIFYNLPYNRLTHGTWIRHRDVKNENDLIRHNQCLIYHEKGTRGKGKGIKVEWTDIE